MLNRPQIFSEPLNNALDHMDRLIASLDEALAEISGSPAFDPDEPSDAEVWLIGRAEEADAFAQDVLQEWMDGKVFPETAAAVLERFIETMHRGLFEHVRYCTPLKCCGAVDPAAAKPGDAVTRAITSPIPRPISSHGHGSP